MKRKNIRETCGIEFSSFWLTPALLLTLFTMANTFFFRTCGSMRIIIEIGDAAAVTSIMNNKTLILHGYLNLLAISFSNIHPVSLQQTHPYL
ncbi:MAG: hypothetical protein R2794_09675 [Chitinophagales bacterium]